ncbi:MAG TPA: enoyl-CoA hydratase/isomerase family protein [Thermoanaerobaculia bacterium]|nr:enoyl-CoA hydratase/isomerase family protein [Thermoanaerobaculia bacterium]
MSRFRLMRNAIVFDDGGMNLLSSEALCELRDLLPTGEPGNRETGQPLTFRSARPGLFAAGADMAEMQRFSPRDAHEFAALAQELFDAIERLPCLTVALIDGDCFGGALDLVLAFDFRFATPRARFAHPGARLGIVTGFGGTSRWQKVLTRRAAHQLFLANRGLSADEALAMGLVDRVAESHEEALASLENVDARLVKELTIHADRLSRAEMLLVARRLAGIYSS